MGSVQGIINLIKPCSDACCATIPSRLCQFLLTAVAGPGRVSCSFEPDYHLTSRDSNGISDLTQIRLILPLFRDSNEISELPRIQPLCSGIWDLLTTYNTADFPL